MCKGKPVVNVRGGVTPAPRGALWCPAGGRSFRPPHPVNRIPHPGQIVKPFSLQK